ncbi:hypothetical protein CCHR01_07987 [Colletotrichum chrysophilum]|uniref:Uncharacterized protein n=1 Tax=Colletotrichum chrysophilum TaxID=1836956 RepID=A0AAD9EIA3_9PEZI|nr:hypothetical protein CCHR01_07987 [Colletotrichum chrysophilum]
MSIAIRDPDQCPSGPSAVNRAGPPSCPRSETPLTIATSIFFTAPNLRNLVAWPGFTAKKRGQPAPTASLRLARGDHGPRDFKVVEHAVPAYVVCARARAVRALRADTPTHTHLISSSSHLLLLHAQRQLTLDMR